MTREEAKVLLPIIQAYAEGKEIESRCVKGDTSLWYDDKDPSFDDDFEYRIKPEPKYRPFKDAEECWQEMLKHQPFGWVKDRNDSRFVIENVDSRGFVEVYDEGTCNFNEVFEFCTFVDGTPFGIIDKEQLWHGQQ